MDNTLIFFFAGIIGFLIILLYQSNKQLSEIGIKQNKLIAEHNKEITELKGNQNKLILEYNSKITSIESSKSKLILEAVEKFKQNEIQAIKIASINEAKVLLEKWRLENESHIRQDAISKSKSVIVGKVTEHLVPFFEEFPFNPKEARFIGSPIDLIVFRGIDDGIEDVSIHFVEIKTGHSQLNKRQKLIKKAIAEKEVYWKEINITTEKKP